MHNKLRRDIVAFLGGKAIGANDLLTRSLAALGGPVEDQRPETETVPTVEGTVVEGMSTIHTEADAMPPAVEGDISIGQDCGDETQAPTPGLLDRARAFLR